MGGVLALLDLGDEPMELTAAPYGANMAFQKDMFQKYGAFRADLDRCGRGMLSNGDTEFGSRLLTAGERLRYEPTAVVHHSVGEKRLTRGYFLAWWFSKGRSDIRQYGIRPGTKRFCLRIPLYLFRGMVISTMRWMLTTSPQQRFSHKLTVWAQLGAIVECFESRRAAVKGSREPLYPAA
jgi:GT2 family glycosyltransferase